MVTLMLFDVFDEQLGMGSLWVHNNWENFINFFFKKKKERLEVVPTIFHLQLARKPPNVGHTLAFNVHVTTTQHSNVSDMQGSAIGCFHTPRAT